MSFSPMATFDSTKKFLEGFLEILIANFEEFQFYNLHISVHVWLETATRKKTMAYKKLTLCPSQSFIYF